MESHAPNPAQMALFLIGCFATVHAGAGSLARLTSRLPDVPAPPQGSVQWVAQSMRINGLPLTLKTFESRLSPGELFNYYERIAARWGHSEFRRSHMRQAQLLSIRGPDHAITVEATATVSGCTGTITVSGLPELRQTAADSAFPRPATARLVNWQEYDDDGIESEHLSLASSRAVAVEAAAFVSELSRAGWQVIREQSMQTSRGKIIEAQRGAQQALITLQSDRSHAAATAIVVVWRKS